MQQTICKLKVGSSILSPGTSFLETGPRAAEDQVEVGIDLA